MSESTPEDSSWVWESCIATPLKLIQLVASMLQMKPTVPNTLIGGKSLTGSIPAWDKAL